MSENTKQIGDKGEDRAAEFLTTAGYEILVRNWRNRFGELDIVAEKNDKLIFVEVKAKRNSCFGAPAEMITTRKLGKLKNAAAAYLKESKWDGPWQIDAVVIENKSVSHLENITL